MVIIAIIGACGFVGKHLINALLKRKYDLLLLDVLPAYPHFHAEEDRYQYYKVDVAEDERLILALFQSHKVELVINISGWGMSTFDMLSEKCWAVNYHGLKNILEACKKANVTKIIHTSTYNVVFHGQTIVAGDETMPYPPLHLHFDEYSKSKCKGEQLALSYNGNDMIVSVIRPGAIYGEDEQRHIPRIVKLMDAGIFSLFKVGNAIVDWVHVDNLVQAYLLLLDRQLSPNESKTVAGQCYFINDDEPINNFDFLTPLCLARGQSVPRLVIPTSLMLHIAYLMETLHRWNLPVPQVITRAEVVKVGVTHYFPPRKAQQELGYKPTIDTTQGALLLAKRYTLFKNDKHNVNYFQSPSFIWWVLVFMGMWLLFEIAFLQPAPNDFPNGKNIFPSTQIFFVQRIRSRIPFYIPCLQVCYKLGYFNFRQQIILQWVFYLAVLTHVLEGLYAFVVARGKGRLSVGASIKWLVQTVMLGYPSLTLLLQYIDRFEQKRT